MTQNRSTIFAVSFALLTLIGFASPALAGWPDGKIISGFACIESTTTGRWKMTTTGTVPIMNAGTALKVVCPINRDNNELNQNPWGLNELKIAVFTPGAQVSCQLYSVSPAGLQGYIGGPQVNPTPSYPLTPAIVRWTNVLVPFDGTVFVECSMPTNGQILYIRYDEM